MSTSTLLQNPDRLRKVFARLDDKDETGRAVAFNLASKALVDAGLGWSDLLEAFLNKKEASTQPSDLYRAHRAQTDSYRAYRADENSHNAFGDIFDGIFGDTFNRSQAQKKPEAKPAPRPRRFVVGKDIPDTISGAIHIVEARDWRGGKMLVVEVKYSDTTYGPMVMFSEKDIAKAEQDPSKLWICSVRPASSADRFPVLSGLREI